MSLNNKRPRQVNNSLHSIIEVVDLTADDEPPRKRQKSVPLANGSINQENAKPTISTDDRRGLDTTALKRAGPSKYYTPIQKATPLRDSQSVSSSRTLSAVNQKASRHLNDIASGDVQKSSSGSKLKERAGQTIERLRDLSLGHTGSESSPLRNTATHDRPRSVPAASHASHHKLRVVEKRDESPISESFKLRSVKALKFNPQTQQTDLRRQNTEFKTRPDSHLKSRFKLNIPPHHSDESKARQNVEIRIPLRSTPTASQSHPRTSPGTSATQLSNKVSVNVPLSDAARSRQIRKELQEKLKQGPGYLEQNSEEVHRFLGLTGFSRAEFPLDLGHERFKNAAQPKKRSVDRSLIVLDMELPTQEIATLELKDPSEFVHPCDQVKAILTDRFSEEFDPPLTFSNSVNDRRLHGKFQFISEYILRKNVKATGAIGHSGCVCAGRCDRSCTCLRKTFKEERSKSERVEYVPQYERRPDGLVVLRDDFIRRYTIQWDTANDEDVPMQRLPERVEISECSDQCPCDESCVNRVVQKGKTVPLDIFETNRCGFGVRSPRDLVHGQFIELYLGEVITETELVRREEAAEAGSTSYIYSLDWFSSPQSYHIDGENFGSAMRFVNHSCDPNAGTFTVLNNKSTKQLHYVAFFAIKDIPAGTEITIDYTPQAAGQTYELRAADEGMERCYCRSANCRQMLWLPGKERKARKKTVGRTFD